LTIEQESTLAAKHGHCTDAAFTPMEAEVCYSVTVAAVIM